MEEKAEACSEAIQMLPSGETGVTGETTDTATPDSSGSKMSRVMHWSVVVAITLAFIACVCIFFVWINFTIEGDNLEGEIRKLQEHPAHVSMVKPFLEKTNQALESTGSGRQIRFKPTDGCVDSNIDGGHGNFLVYPNTCGNSPTQLWQLEEKMLMVRRDKTGAKKCLRCWNEARECSLVVTACNGTLLAEMFDIKSTRTQIDAGEKRFYFTIHNHIHPNDCATLYKHPDHKREQFSLKNCTGADNQLFYLGDVDYKQEFEEMFTVTS